MNATEMLDHGHLMIIQAIDSLNELGWEMPGACGNWTIKEIIAHLASYEHALVDILNTFLGQEPKPYLAQFLQDTTEFNKEEVEKRRYETAQHVEDEYNDVQVQAVSLLAQIPAEKVMQRGTMPWYKQDCCLNDIITTFYNHTCEHCTQIAAFREERNV